MEDIKTIHIMIFIVITALLYHFMNSGCSCGKLGGVVEGLVTQPLTVVDAGPWMWRRRAPPG